MKENTSQKKKPARRRRIAGQNMRKDSATTLLFKTCNENFAELFNRTMSDLEQINPEDLSEEDIKEAAYLQITKDDGGIALGFLCNQRVHSFRINPESPAPGYAPWRDGARKRW